jgi:hypothetical protein
VKNERYIFLVWFPRYFFLLFSSFTRRNDMTYRIIVDSPFPEFDEVAKRAFSRGGTDIPEALSIVERYVPLGDGPRPCIRLVRLPVPLCTCIAPDAHTCEACERQSIPVHWTLHGWATGDIMPFAEHLLRAVKAFMAGESYYVAGRQRIVAEFCEALERLGVNVQCRQVRHFEIRCIGEFKRGGMKF